MLLLADSHLLGPRRRHWLDVIWSDWGIQKALAVALLVHAPDVVVLNGDVFDEGNIASDEEFTAACARFRRIFALAATPSLVAPRQGSSSSSASFSSSSSSSCRGARGPLLLVGSGNHDVGLGSGNSARRVRRFEEEVVGVAGTEVECVCNASLVFLNAQVLHPASNAELRAAETARIASSEVRR
jgi:hypothetical protein